MSEHPKVQVEFTQAFCARHGEPFRDAWPKGVGIAIPTLVTVFAKLEEVAVYSQGDAGRFQAAIGEFGPMCCAVSDKEMLSIYMRSDIGTLGNCERCGQGRQGTPYRVKHGGGVRRIDHICFECVVRPNQTILPPV